MNNKTYYGKTAAPGKREQAAARAAKKRKANIFKRVCWLVVPTATAALMVLDMLAIYAFTSERLRVLAICLAVILLPFFSEVTVKNFSVKRWPAKEEGDT